MQTQVIRSRKKIQEKYLKNKNKGIKEHSIKAISAGTRCINSKTTARKQCKAGKRR